MTFTEFLVSPGAIIFFIWVAILVLWNIPSKSRPRNTSNSNDLKKVDTSRLIKDGKKQRQAPAKPHVETNKCSQHNGKEFTDYDYFDLGVKKAVANGNADFVKELKVALLAWQHKTAVNLSLDKSALLSSYALQKLLKLQPICDRDLVGTKFMNRKTLKGLRDENFEVVLQVINSKCEKYDPYVRSHNDGESDTEAGMKICILGRAVNGRVLTYSEVAKYNDTILVYCGKEDAAKSTYLVYLYNATQAQFDIVTAVFATAFGIVLSQSIDKCNRSMLIVRNVVSKEQKEVPGRKIDLLEFDEEDQFDIVHFCDEFDRDDLDPDLGEYWDEQNRNRN